MSVTKIKFFACTYTDARTYTHLYILYGGISYNNFKLIFAVCKLDICFN